MLQGLITNGVLILVRTSGKFSEIKTSDFFLDTYGVVRLIEKFSIILEGFHDIK